MRIISLYLFNRDLLTFMHNFIFKCSFSLNTYAKPQICWLFLGNAHLCFRLLSARSCDRLFLSDYDGLRNWLKLRHCISFIQHTNTFSGCCIMKLELKFWTVRPRRTFQLRPFRKLSGCGFATPHENSLVCCNIFNSVNSFPLPVPQFFLFSNLILLQPEELVLLLIFRLSYHLRNFGTLVQQ